VDVPLAEVVAGLVMTAAAVTALLVLLRALLGLWRFARKIQYFLRDWNGEPRRPGRPPSKGVLDRLADLEADVAVIKSEIRPNGGASMWDAVDDVRRNTPGTTPPPRPRRAYQPPDDQE
jgi:hypothetical protein